jgi:uncharacterized membrane protein
VSDIKARDALGLWLEAGLLEQAKAEQLAAFLDTKSPSTRDGGRLVKIISIFGAALVGLGLILYVASHWSGMGPALRIGTLFLAYATVAGSALLLARRGYERVARSLWLLATLTVGANIFLIGQIFNLTLTFWQGPFLWLLATLAMGYALASRAHAWLAIPLALLALGWLGGGEAWFSDDQLEALFSEYGLRPLLPLLGLGLAALALLVQRLPDWRFASGTWLIWGVLLIAVPLVVGTVHEELMAFLFDLRFTPKQWTIIGVCAALGGASFWLGHFSSRSNRWLAALVALLLLGALAVGATGGADQAAVFPIYVVLVFALALWLCWAGVISARPALVNIGVSSAAAVVLIQYFSWSLRLLDRSLAFILGGIVLILVSIWIERQRRRLLARITG